MLSSPSPTGSRASSGVRFPARSTAPVLRSRRSLPRLAAWGAVAAACAYLLVELVPDVGSKPLFEDEAVSGLISARPFGEMIATTMWDRGGAPLHFVLVHLAFLFDSSPEALRWISVVFAVAA